MFIETWNKYFHGIPMFGWKLRENKSESWFRIHSLPDSKRCPEHEPEQKILLSRHNEIATEVLGRESEIILYWCGIKSFHGIHGVKTMNYEDGDIETTIFAAEGGCWEPGKFDNVILDVANWELPSIVFLNRGSGNVYAPYDGGADIFVFDKAIRSKLIDKYSRWASARPDGL